MGRLSCFLRTGFDSSFLTVEVVLREDVSPPTSCGIHRQFRNEVNSVEALRLFSPGFQNELTCIWIFINQNLAKR